MSARYDGHLRAADDRARNAAEIGSRMLLERILAYQARHEARRAA